MVFQPSKHTLNINFSQAIFLFRVPFIQFPYSDGPYLLNLRVTWLGLLFGFEFEFDLVKSMTSCTIRTDELLELVLEGAVRSDPQYVWLLLESSYAFLSRGIVSSKEGLALCTILRGLDVTDSDLDYCPLIYGNYIHSFDILENLSILFENKFKPFSRSCLFRYKILQFFV